MAKSTTSRIDQDLLDRSKRAIAHGSLTNSKRPQSFVQGVYPVHLTRGEGCFVWDTKGNKYIDYICGLGTNLLGYGNDRISRAIFNASRNGLTLSLGTPEEVECAERLKEFFPWVDQMRFLHGGSAAVHAALRIARAKTGRTMVLSHGYHGWQDEFVSLSPPAIGCVSTDNICEYLDHEGLLWPEKIAAIIVEPVITDASPERATFLRGLRDFCTRHGIVLIFDEIITGLRYEKYSVSRAFGIDPDLICLGKALGGGADLSVVAGKHEIMECGEYFVSATHAGERTGLVACIETLKMLKDKVYDLDQLLIQGARFQKTFNLISSDVVTIEGYPTRGVFKFRDELTKHLFFQECCLAGILVGASFFYCFSHPAVNDIALNIFRDVITKIKLGLATPIGEPPQSPFAQRVRGNA